MLQDGTIYATKGHIGGTFTGKLQIGNIEIEDTTSTRGALIIRDDYNINNILARIGEDNSFFRTNLHFQNRETGNVFATMKTDINEFNFSKGSSINLDSGNTNTSIKLIADGLYASVIRMGNVDLCAFDTTARFEHPSLLKPISVTVGSAAVKTSSLNVNGSIQAYNSINLGTKVTMKETSDGIGFFVN